METKFIVAIIHTSKSEIRITEIDEFRSIGDAEDYITKEISNGSYKEYTILKVYRKLFIK